MAGTLRTPLWALILAGGDGRRLESLTRVGGVSTPKQYCSLNGGLSLLQLSLKRALRLVSRERIVVVVSEQHRRWWEHQLLGWLPGSNIIVQPSNRGTGLGMLLPLLVMEKTSPKAAVVCLPSDHYIAQEELLANSLRHAIELCALNCDKLTLLGIEPTSPDTNLGYVTPFTGSEGDVGFEGDVRPVQWFIEKPEQEQAARLIQQGSLWNSGIVVGLLQAVLYLYPRHVPGLLRNLKPIVRLWSNPQVPSPELTAFYARHAEIDFSRDILQKQPARLQMLKVPLCGWNDVGTPARLLTTLRTLQPQTADTEASASQAAALNLSVALSSAFARNQSVGGLEGRLPD